MGRARKDWQHWDDLTACDLELCMGVFWTPALITVLLGDIIQKVKQKS